MHSRAWLGPGNTTRGGSMGAKAHVTTALIVGYIACGFGAVGAAAPGDQYPSMKTVFSDPKSGNEVWRMTTDGAQHGVTNAMGDQSSESSSWSPDSRRICYWKKGNGYRPTGVYMMDIASGSETYLAPAESNVHGGQIFSRDGAEVYYYHAVSTGTYDVRAVNTSTFAVRTIVGSLAMSSPQKITQNADGSYIAIHQWGEPKTTGIVNPHTGEFHPQWRWDNGLAGEDGSQWHPSDPDIIFAVRGTKAVRNINTLEVINPGYIGDISHSSWHPNGNWIVNSKVYEIASATVIGEAKYPGHPNINPADASLDWQARMVMDAQVYLFVMTIRDFVDHNFPKDASRIWVTHYSTETLNHAHPHPHFSPDGRYILWQSDVDNLSAGTPPGGQGGPDQIDLFIAPYGAQATESAREPVIDPLGGTYAGPEASVPVTLTCETEGAAIHYTTDGSTPTTSSSLYSAPFTLTFSTTTVLQARAFSADLDPSSTASATFAIAQTIEGVSLVSYGGAHPQDVSLVTVATGTEYYADRQYVISSLPPDLAGGTLVQYPNDDKTDTSDQFIVLSLVEPAVVTVAYDSRATPPSWLDDWDRTAETIDGEEVGGTGNTVSFNVYQMQYGENSTVTLPGNMAGGGDAATGYIVVAAPVGQTPVAAQARHRHTRAPGAIYCVDMLGRAIPPAQSATPRVAAAVRIAALGNGTVKRQVLVP